MHWQWSWRFDPAALPLADRHYNRQKVGSPQFMPPGECVVLRTPSADALWGSSRQRFVKHAWPGAWNCSVFRNEGGVLSSTLVLEAIAATRHCWGDPPPEGMITFVDPRKIQSRNPGYCFRRAGFTRVGETTKGLWVFHLQPAHFPDAQPALGERRPDWRRAA